MASKGPRLSVALVHFPVYNKEQEVVVTSLTTLNLHDLARLTVTYGTAGCYVVTPLPRQQVLAQQIIAHWTQGYGAVYNPTRAEALQHLRVVEDLAALEHDIVQRYGMVPRYIATDARQFPGSISYAALRRLLWDEDAVFVLLLGTGWGLSRELIAQCTHVLTPIYGPTSYNHLPVRVAAGIMLDRLLGVPERSTSSLVGS